MDYMHCVVSEDMLLKHYLQGKKQSHPSWLKIIIRISLVTALKRNGLLSPRKDYIHNLIVVQYQKYFEVCHAIVNMLKLLLTKKNQIFKVKEILLCHNY